MSVQENKQNGNILQFFGLFIVLVCLSIVDSNIVFMLTKLIRMTSFLVPLMFKLSLNILLTSSLSILLPWYTINVICWKSSLSPPYLNSFIRRSDKLENLTRTYLVLWDIRVTFSTSIDFKILLSFTGGMQRDFYTQML